MVITVAKAPNALRNPTSFIDRKKTKGIATAAQQMIVQMDCVSSAEVPLQIANRLPPESIIKSTETPSKITTVKKKATQLPTTPNASLAIS